jgi:N-acetylglucosaminyl-diphospho-decaprenol L-rhamnosyltransferase
VVDGGSYDGCDEMLECEFPKVRFIQCKKNVGFAKANNFGFLQSLGETILFLNPDTELVGPAIDTLYRTLMSLNNPGIIGAKLLNTDLSLQLTSIQAFPTILNQLCDAEIIRQMLPRLSMWGMAPLFASTKEPTEAQAISGACMFARRSILESVNVFSEDYFMYSEDVDLSYKLAQAGFQNYYVSTATIIHHGGCSSTKNHISHFSSVMLRESRWKYFKKTKGSLYGLGYRTSMILLALLRLSLLSVWRIFKISSVTPTSVAASFGKWLEILKWGLGMNGRYRNY